MAVETLEVEFVVSKDETAGAFERIKKNLADTIKALDNVGKQTVNFGKRLKGFAGGLGGLAVGVGLKQLSKYFEFTLWGAIKKSLGILLNFKSTLGGMARATAGFAGKTILGGLTGEAGLAA